MNLLVGGVGFLYYFACVYCVSTKICFSDLYSNDLKYSITVEIKYLRELKA